MRIKIYNLNRGERLRDDDGRYEVNFLASIGVRDCVTKMWTKKEQECDEEEIIKSSAQKRIKKINWVHFNIEESTMQCGENDNNNQTKVLMARSSVNLNGEKTHSDNRMAPKIKER